MAVDSEKLRKSAVGAVKELGLDLIVVRYESRSPAYSADPRNLTPPVEEVLLWFSEGVSVSFSVRPEDSEETLKERIKEKLVQSQ